MVQQASGADKAASQLVIMFRFLGLERARLSRALADAVPEGPGEEASEEQLQQMRIASDLIVPRDAPSDDLDIPLGTYVVSIRPRSDFRRLRRVGDCSMRPGLEDFTFEVLGMVRPDASRYHARCGRCWKEATESVQVRRQTQPVQAGVRRRLRRELSAGKAQAPWLRGLASLLWTHLAHVGRRLLWENVISDVLQSLLEAACFCYSR